ncbi:thioester domain-containing protein [Arthrobacter sp. zg-Y179]|uniref:thioester domain-containing protein n=1 Tax=Arthrobacter sp. zg-Y179 TaxID=2894188 RepID=UPI001E2C8395|nr:thioester domain-containing protein [Arthrobacter sp. zg-Y179]MCC9176051.1 thioester domain-containing protein [Arthrobacter sp. zg-Y179]
MAAAAALLLAPFAAPANASWTEPDPNEPAPVAGTNAEVVTTDLGPAQRVQAFVADNPIPPDPLAPYPEGNPVGVPVTGRFAGIILTEDAGGGIGQMYCIDTAVETMVGIGYVQGAWDESNVANIGYVNYILNNYYPANPAAPAGLTANQQAAAVQGAIWYFTDGYLVNTAETVIRPAVEAIVADAQANGPLVEPPPPNVTVTPPVAAGPAGGVAGPFTVAAEGAMEVTVSVPTGYTMFADAAGAVPIPSGSVVASGTQVWVGGPPASTVPGVLSARAAVNVQTGNVYLYDQGDPLLDNAQPLILAASTVLEATAGATAEFFVPGDLLVNKTFAGEAAGSQGAIALTVDCGTVGMFSFEIPAGTAAPVSETIVDLPVGTVCSVTEPVTGSTAEVTVTPTVSDPVTITEGENVLAVTNTVEFNPGNLVVAKTISGSGAGLQDDIVLHIQCGDGIIDEIFLIPEGTTADTFTQLYEGIPAGVLCRVSEPTSGANEDVTVESTGTAEVTILPGQSQTFEVVNEYAPVPVTERLPRTGADGATGLGAVAAAAVLAGSLLVLGSTRRRHNT